MSENTQVQTHGRTADARRCTCVDVITYSMFSVYMYLYVATYARVCYFKGTRRKCVWEQKIAGLRNEGREEERDVKSLCGCAACVCADRRAGPSGDLGHPEA